MSIIFVFINFCSQSVRIFGVQDVRCFIMFFVQSIFLLFILISYYAKQNTAQLNVYISRTYIAYLCLFYGYILKHFYQAGEGIIGHRGIRFVSVCLSSACHQTPPSLWDQSLPKFIFGFFRRLQGSVKI